MILKATQTECGHGYTMGFCPNFCTKYSSHQEKILVERSKFVRMFRVSEMKNSITKETFIRKLQSFHDREQYLQKAENIITTHN